MPAAGMESLHNLRYNIHSHDSHHSNNGYVRVAYHSKADFHPQKTTEEGPIDFSLKTNSEEIKRPEVDSESRPGNSQSYHSGNTMSNHLQERNSEKKIGSMLEHHLRNANNFAIRNQHRRSPVFEAAQFEDQSREQTVSPTHLNAQSHHKLYYGTGEHRKTNEESLSHSQTTVAQFIRSFSEDRNEHNSNENHSPGADQRYRSISSLHQAGAQYAYSRNLIDKKREVSSNGTFQSHEFPEKRSHSPPLIKHEEYIAESVANPKDFKINNRLSTRETFNESKDVAAIDDGPKTSRNKNSEIQPALQNSALLSRYLRNDISNTESDTHTTFQPMLSTNANPFVPNVYNNMGIMNHTVTPNFPHLNPLAYPPAMLSSFNPYLNASPLTHHLNPMSTVNSERKNDKSDRPFKQFANELIYGMQTLLPVKSPMVDKNYISVTEATSSTLSPHLAKPKTYSKERSPSTERLSPSAAPQTSQMTPSDESANSVSPTHHVNDHKHSQSEQMEDGDLNKANEDEKGPNDSNSSFSDAMPNNQQPPDTSSSNGKRRSLPDHMKNDLYWAKRRKNNAAAKRSRDARRKKEDMLAITAKTLRDQNYQLQIVMAAMQEQITFQTTENKRLSDKCNTQEIQIFRLKEDQERNQKLCRRCSARILDADVPGNGL